MGFAFGERRSAMGSGERSHMALVLFLRSFSRLTTKAPRTRSRIRARSAFQRLRGKFLQSRTSSSSREALFRQCGLCGHGPLSPMNPFSRPVPFSYGGPQVMSLSLLPREEWVRIRLPPWTISGDAPCLVNSEIGYWRREGRGAGCGRGKACFVRSECVSLIN